jgi:predicted component of type VI protein secretion system
MKTFLNVCGLDDSLRLVIERPGESAVESRRLSQPFALIGRDPRADVVLDDEQVSRRHVYLQVVDGQAFWVDLESRTGTRGDGEFQKSGWLDAGQTLGVGPFVIRRSAGESRIGTDRRGEPTRVAPFVAVPHDPAMLPQVSLEFLNGSSKATEWPVRRMMSLMGSASGCKFRLTDSSVSSFHASLLRTSVGLWVVDLLGHDGITVNEVPLRFSHLVHGDRLRIGRYQIRISYRDPHQEPGAGSADRARVAAIAHPPRHEKASNGLMIPAQKAAEMASNSGVIGANGLELPMASQALSPLKFEATAPGITFPLQLATGEVSEAMLVPLVGQFAVMQQQMFDQFQQAMAMMFQMFGTMHRDQMAVIREELDRLRDITEEFHALKKEMAERTQAQNSTAASGPGVTSGNLTGLGVTEPLVSPRTAPSERANGLEAGRRDANAAVRPPSSASNIPGYPRSTTPPLSATSATLKTPAGQPPSERPRASGEQPEAKSDGTRAPDNPERDSVLWLHQRIMTLENERETRWQKILKLLPGAS